MRVQRVIAVQSKRSPSGSFALLRMIHAIFECGILESAPSMNELYLIAIAMATYFAPSKFAVTVTCAP